MAHLLLRGDTSPPRFHDRALQPPPSLQRLLAVASVAVESCSEPLLQLQANVCVCLSFEVNVIVIKERKEEEIAREEREGGREMGRKYCTRTAFVIKLSSLQVSPESQYKV